jgi:hypothetical protein
MARKHRGPARCSLCGHKPRGNDRRDGRDLGPGNRVGCLRGRGVGRQHDLPRNRWEEWFSAWETVQFDYELVDAGERVVMLLDLAMRGRATGIEVPFGKFAWVSTFKDGLVVHVKLYMSQAQALEAVGLRE